MDLNSQLVLYHITNLKYSVPKEFPLVFHNGCNYDYHSIIKELEEQFEGQFTCLGENTEKCITFSVTIENEVTRIDKKEKDITKTISYRLHLLIVQDLWQAYHQAMLIILLKD